MRFFRTQSESAPHCWTCTCTRPAPVTRRRLPVLAVLAGAGLLLAPRPVQLLIHPLAAPRPPLCATGDDAAAPANECSRGRYRFAAAATCDRLNDSLEAWESPCVRPRDHFLAGEPVHLWVQIDNVAVDHRLKVGIYRNGRLVHRDEGHWTYPDRTHHSVHLTATERNTLPGHYRFDFGLQTPRGFEHLGSREIRVGVRSPVHGALRRQCYWPLEASVWSFCQHRPQGNHAASGVAGADDDNAWDVNLRDFLDTRRPVFPVAPGRVVRYGGSEQPGDGRSAGVLIEHHTADGQRWWSGYLHMRRDSIALREGEYVDTDTMLGRIGRSGTRDNHLHFVVYDGVNEWGGLRSIDAELHPREIPGPLRRARIARRLARPAGADPMHATAQSDAAAARIASRAEFPAAPGLLHDQSMCRQPARRFPGSEVSQAFDATSNGYPSAPS